MGRRNNIIINESEGKNKEAVTELGRNIRRWNNISIIMAEEILHNDANKSVVETLVEMSAAIEMNNKEVEVFCLC